MRPPSAGEKARRPGQMALAERTGEEALPRASVATRTKGGISSPAAIAAAFVLFAHTLFIGFSAGAHASPAQLDAFGNPLCLGILGLSGGKDSGDRHSPHSCCTFGCHFAAAAPLTDRVPVLVAYRPSALVAWLPRAIPSRSGFDRSSIQPRGPPRLV